MKKMDKKQKILLLFGGILIIVILVFIVNVIIIKEKNANTDKESITIVLEKTIDKEQTDDGNISSPQEEKATNEVENKDMEDTDDNNSIPPKKIEGIDTNRSYESHFEFPYDNIPITTDEIFELIKKSYEEVNFYGEFKRGNLEVYDYYKEKFYQLITSKVPFTYSKKAQFTYPITDKKEYINEFTSLYLDYEEQLKDAERYEYYFFDMDEDSTPELCVRTVSAFSVDIFKYIKDTDEFVLWYELPMSYEKLSGSKKIRWSGDGLNQLVYNYDEKGVVECEMAFYSKLVERKEDVDFIYMAGLPRYKFGEGPIIISDEIKRQGYFSEALQMYFYRLKEDQYKELYESFTKAEEVAREKLEEVTYTYEELFGEYEK